MKHSQPLTDDEANEAGMIYSPEATDGHSWGDWPTKLVAMAIIIVVVILAAYLLSGCALIECLTDWEHGCPD